MKLKNRNLYKKSLQGRIFFLLHRKKLSDINRVEEFKENIMLDHRTETFMAVCSVMNYREAAELLHITHRSHPAYPVSGERIRLPPFSL